ncbi:hypothetical protein SAY86_010847 [Trapa natans]|uniref:Sugar phosphate transporter domain-containing protein n=1 Tax=Trapa natans TaxID=22666 RepID=A0AAN7LL76_TRANT|nr:hypothetical protein SAY86_010847 [Trapa natans]
MDLLGQVKAHKSLFAIKHIVDRLRAFILLSCTIVVGTNLSQFICIGRFTAVSFQMVGHMKTILVLILGFIFFSKEGLNLQVVLGIIGVVAGMISYENASSKPRDKERLSYSPNFKIGEKYSLLEFTAKRRPRIGKLRRGDETA